MNFYNTIAWHDMGKAAVFFLGIYLTLFGLCIATFVIDMQNGQHSTYSNLKEADIKFDHYANFMHKYYGMPKDITAKYSIADLGASIVVPGTDLSVAGSTWEPPTAGESMSYRFWLNKVQTPHNYIFGMKGYVRSKATTNTAYHNSIADATPWWAYTHGLFKNAIGGGTDISHYELNKYNHCWHVVRSIDQVIAILFIVLIVIGIFVIGVELGSYNLCSMPQFQKFCKHKWGKRIEAYMLVLMQIAIISSFGVWSSLLMGGIFNNDKCNGMMKGPVANVFVVFYIVLAFGVYASFAFGQSFVYWGHKAEVDHRYDGLKVVDPRAEPSNHLKTAEEQAELEEQAETTAELVFQQNDSTQEGIPLMLKAGGSV